MVLLQQNMPLTRWADRFEQVSVKTVHALRGLPFQQFAMIAQAAVSEAGLHCCLVSGGGRNCVGSADRAISVEADEFE